MLKFLIGRKYAAKHKEIFNCEALKAERTLKNIWRDVDTILFRVASSCELVCTRIPGCFCEKN